MPLFQINSNNLLQRTRAGSFEIEKKLQQLIEKNLEEVFGVRFIATEFVVRGDQPGRIDTLGLDSEGSPTIIEYKRDRNENVINQGLYYLHWLLDHTGDFVVAAREKLGTDIQINWSHPRLIIVAQSYAKWDTYAVNLMGEGIELWEYVRYGDNLLYLNQIYGQQRSVTQANLSRTSTTVATQNSIETEYSIEGHLRGKPQEIRDLFEKLQESILSLSLSETEIIETPNKLYISYRHGKNFCEVVILAKSIKLFLDITLAELKDPFSLARDVSSVGHWGTGDLEVKLNSDDDLEKVMQLVEQSYRLTV